MRIPLTVRGKLIMSKSLYFLIAALCSLCLGHSIAEAKSSICSPPSDCGNGVPIRYPFWVSNNSTQEHCGYPGFGLTCSDHGPPTITLPSNTYYVTYKLRLLNTNTCGHGCGEPNLPQSTPQCYSLGNFPLSFDYQLNVNLIFYFNCSAYNAHFPPQHIVCLTNEGLKQSYVVESTYDRNLDCEDKVLVAVKEAEISIDNLVGGFGEAMKKGFLLDRGTAMGCADCENSGEFCGHNQINHQMLCFCSDGSIATKSCSKDTFPFV